MAILPFLTPPLARGHIELNSPNGGETLHIGSMPTIAWMLMVAAHDTLNFDLRYSAVGDSGPLTVIAIHLPPGALFDGNENGRIDAGDYSVWKPNFGESEEGGARGAATGLHPSRRSAYCLLDYSWDC